MQRSSLASSAPRRQWRLQASAGHVGGDPAQPDPLRPRQPGKKQQLPERTVAEQQPQQQPPQLPLPPPQQQQQRTADATSAEAPSADQAQAMTAALLQAMAFMRQDHTGVGPPPQPHNSGNGSGSGVAAAQRGTQAAADTLRQYSTGGSQPASNAAATAPVGGSHSQSSGLAAGTQPRLPPRQPPGLAAASAVPLPQPTYYGPPLPSEPPLPRAQWPPRDPLLETGGAVRVAGSQSAPRHQPSLAPPALEQCVPVTPFSHCPMHPPELRSCCELAFVVEGAPQAVRVGAQA